MGMTSGRRVIGIGETVLDILFRDGKPVAAVHGGSCFNSIISLGRAGVPCLFAGYAAQDVVGNRTRDFLRANGVATDFFELRGGRSKSAVSLAYINENGDADYVFYKFTPTLPKRWRLPSLEAGDILLMGSYFAISRGTREKIQELLAAAREAGATVYYDINFRRTHAGELAELTPAIQHNCHHSTIVRGSADDFEIMYGTRSVEEIYHRLHPYCPVLVYTAGGGDVVVRTPQAVHRFPVPQVEGVVSTVGAGDSFNAGLICALRRDGVGHKSVSSLSAEAWQRIVSLACAFAAEACKSTDNYISTKFARTIHI